MISVRMHPRLTLNSGSGTVLTRENKYKYRATGECDGRSEGGDECPVGAGGSNRGRRRQILNTLHHIPTGIDRSLDPNPILARIRPTLANRSHGVLTTEGTTAIRQLPSAPSSETDTSGDSGACQRAPVGDSLNDEQWSNDLSIPSSHETTRQRIGDPGKHEPESHPG